MPTLAHARVGNDIVRIALVSTFYSPWSLGGDGLAVAQLAKALRRRGHCVQVIFSYDAYSVLSAGLEEVPSGKSESGFVPVKSRLPKLELAATYLTGHPVGSRRSLQRALSGPWDILHYHNPSLLGGPAIMQMGIADLKLYTMHEQWLVCPTHVLYRYNREVCTERHCVRCCLASRRPPQPWRATRLMSHATAGIDRFIAPSRTTAELNKSIAPLAKTTVLANFTPEPQASFKKEMQDYFLYVGRLEPIKGIVPLLRDFARLTDLNLVVAGDGRQRPLVEQLAAAAPHIRFLGRLGGADLDALYAGAVATIVPSTGHESFPLVVAESLARSTPVIVRALGALKEISEQSEGAVLPFRTFDEFAVILRSLAEDHARAVALGLRGRVVQQRRWSEEVHVSAYFRLIAKEAARKGAERLAQLATTASTALPPPGDGGP